MASKTNSVPRRLASPGAANSAPIDYTECLEQIKEVLENPTLIQSDAFQLACVKNEEGEITGIVSACKKIDSDGNVIGWTYFLHESGKPAVEYEGDWDACADLQDLIDSICEKFDILNSTVCPQPPCASTDPELAAVTYTNSDNATEMSVSVGGDGDIKITSGGGDSSDAEITAYIESCLTAGHDVELSMSGVDGDTASATLLAAATTNAFPGFYNQSVNATATLSQSFKVDTMTATCLQTAEEAGNTQKTYDQCAVEALEEITEALACQVQETGLFISSNDDYCGLKVFYSKALGGKVFFNPTSQTYEILDMGIQTTPYQPPQSQICAEAQYAAYELTTGSTSVEKIADAILAANPLTFNVAGNAIPVTIDDLAFIKITPKQCGTLDSAGVEVELDFISVNGTAASDFVDLEAGGVDGSTLIEVPAAGCAVVDVCFKKCWSKQEVAAL